MDGGAAVEVKDRNLVWGSSVFAPMIVGYQRGDGSPLRYQGNELGLTHLTYFSPTVAFPISDELTFGVGLHFNYTGVGIDLDFRLPNAILVGVDSFSGLLCELPEIDAVVNVCEGDLGPFTDIGVEAFSVADAWGEQPQVAPFIGLRFQAADE